MSTVRRVVLLFVLAGTLWIVLSDQVLLWLGLTPEYLTRVQTIKGLVFVSLTGLLIYFLLGRAWRQRSRLRLRLREADERLEPLLAHLPGLVYRRRQDGDWNVSYASAGALEVTGFSATELVDGRAEPWIHPLDRERVEQEISTALAAGRPYGIGYRLLHASGEERWVWDQGRAVSCEDGAPVLEGFLLDSTARKRLEEQLAQTQKMEAIGRLAGGIAHDFNNLLTAVLGYTQALLERKGADDPDRHALQEIARAAQRAAALTRQLMTFSRPCGVERRPVELGALVEGARGLLAGLLGEDAELVIEPAPEPLTCLADEGQLVQVLVNLVLNARDAQRPGRITISSRAGELPLWGLGRHAPGGPFVELAVGDTGPGIPGDVEGRLFEPFFTTKAAGEGAGLGLPTALAIVEEAGGAIAFESEPGRGSTFRVRLPRTERSVAPRSPEPPGLLGPLRSCRVLVVEDEDQIRKLMRWVLTDLGCEVLEASSAEQALELLSREPLTLDLLISDVILPGQSGRDLVDRLREELPDLTVLYVSGYPGDRLDGVGLGLGQGTTLLAKPFTPKQLAAAVQRSLSWPQHQRI